MKSASLMSSIRDHLPEKVGTLTETVTLIREALHDVSNSAALKVQTLISSGRFDESRELLDLCQSVQQLDAKLEALVEALCEHNTPPQGSNPTAETSSTQSGWHFLTENFTHTKPRRYAFREREPVHVESWQAVLVSVCQHLHRLDADKLMSFPEKRHMNGVKRKHFSFDPTALRVAKPLNRNLFVEVNLSANSIAKVIRKMLKEYGLDPTDICVELL